jgi:hypothetical protein
LIDFGMNSPALPAGHPFTGVQNNYYISSTTHIYNTYQAWFMLMDYGSVRSFSKDAGYYVWPVRGGN